MERVLCFVTFVLNFGPFATTTAGGAAQLPAASADSGSAPGDAATTVFVPGEAGADGKRWTCYRIPVLVLVNGSTLLAIVEARSYTGDGCYPKHPAPMDNTTNIVVKRSTDSGATWDTHRNVVPGAVNPEAVYDVATQTVLVAYCGGRALHGYQDSDASCFHAPMYSLCVDDVPTRVVFLETACRGPSKRQIEYP